MLTSIDFILVLFLIGTFLSFWQEKGRTFAIITFAILLRFSLIFLIQKGTITLEIGNEEYLYWLEQWREIYKEEYFYGIYQLIAEISPRIWNREYSSNFSYNSIYAAYFTIGWDTTRLQLFNSLLSIHIIHLVNNTSLIVNKQKLKTAHILIILFFPSYIYYSIDVGRTVPSLLVFIHLFNSSIIFLRNKTIKNLTILIISIYLVSIFRLVYIAMPVVIILNHYFSKKITISYKSYFILLLMLISILIGSIEYFDSLENNEDWDQLYGGSSYLTNIFPSNFFDYFWYTPLQGIYFLLSPMVWNISSFQQFIVSLTTTVILFYIYKRLRKKNRIILIKYIIPLIILSLVYGVGVKNAGSAQRWRLPIVILLFVIATPEKRQFKIELNRKKHYD